MTTRTVAFARMGTVLGTGAAVPVVQLGAAPLIEYRIVMVDAPVLGAVAVATVGV